MSAAKDDPAQRLSAELERIVVTDDQQFLLDSLLAIESKEMLTELLGHQERTVTYGDGSYQKKALRVLEAGARQILDGKAPPEFLKLIAGAVVYKLNGKVASIDVALGLTNARGRPRKDPADVDSAVHAFLEVMQCTGDSANWERKSNAVVVKLFRTHQ